MTTSGPSSVDDHPQSPAKAEARHPESDYALGMKLLTHTIEDLSQARSVDEVQRIVAVTARHITGCDGATLVIRDQENCFYADEDSITPLWKGKRFPLEACISGWVMLNKKPAVISDIYRDERIPHDAYRPTFVKSLIMVPVRRRYPIAAIGNYWSQEREPTEHEVTLLQALADVTAVAIESVQVHALLEQQNPTQSGTPKASVASRSMPIDLDVDGDLDTFAAAFTNAPIGMAVVGLDGRFQRANAELCRITGYSEKELTALTFQDITHPDDLDTDLAEASRLLAGEIASYQMDKRYYSKDGRVVWVRLSVFMIHDSAGEPRSFVSHIEDISARRRDEELLRRQATLDALTGVYNRRRFDEELRRYAAVAALHSAADEAAVFMIDLDGLKQVNDQRGHIAGDTYLKTVADVISRRLRLSDVVGRIGGDEFAVLLPHTTAAQAQHLAQTLVEEVRMLSPGGICIGIATVTPDTVHDALERADRAMYRAKRQGGSHWSGPDSGAEGSSDTH